MANMIHRSRNESLLRVAYIIKPLPTVTYGTYPHNTPRGIRVCATGEVIHRQREWTLEITRYR